MLSRNLVNDSVAALLLLVLALSPLPLGSNRPVFWALSAAVIFAAMAVFLLQPPKHIRPLWPALWPVAFLIAAYLAYMALQAVFGLSTTPRASFLALLRTLSYGAFFVLMVQVSRNKTRLYQIAFGVFAIAVAYALFGYIQLVGKIDLPAAFGLSHYPGRASGTFINPNSYATYLGFGLITGLSLLLRRLRQLRGPHAKNGFTGLADIKLVALGLATTLILLTLLATNSRMGVASALIAAGFFMLLTLHKSPQIAPRASIAAALGLMLLIALAFTLYGSLLLERLGSLEQDADMRLALYRQVWDMVMARPLAGWGADSFPVAFQGFHRLPVSPDLVWNKAHNTYLANWTEMGLVFGSLPLLAGILLFKALFFAMLGAGKKQVFLLAALSVLLQSALHSTVDFSLEIQANMYMFLAILALGTAQMLKIPRGPAPNRGAGA